MKTLVVYFTRIGENIVNGEVEIITKGFTEVVAEKIAAKTGATLYKLEPEVPYPTNYEECVKRSRVEDQYNEKGAYTAGFGLRTLNIPRSDAGLNHK